ncbi:carboxypeptidase-like regulatory domain-containing protein [Dyadobacter sp. 676]|uniref:Carboxypeptidase-like regulatory domain-containing protein n=1 Tax=Dyadobacter sp. 676 TaxID=3088362 RepID=A0AAU8FSL8_9BACT
MIRRYLYILLLLFTFTSLHAGTLKGKLLEAATGEPALGVVIVVEGTNLHDISGLDGSFSIPNLQKGSYRLSIRHISYTPIQKEFAISGNEVVQMDLLLEAAAGLKLEEVAVTGKRDGASDNTARLMERNASQVMNIVSGKTIQISPRPHGSERHPAHFRNIHRAQQQWRWPIRDPARNGQTL